MLVGRFAGIAGNEGAGRVKGNDGQTAENPILSEDFLQLWHSLSRNQQRFAVAMLEHSSKKAAALAVGVIPDTVYRWPEAVDKAIAMMLENAAATAYDILEDSVVKAAMVRRDGLDSDDERLKQMVAEAVLDRIMGKPTQRQEISGPEGESVPIKISEVVVEIPKGDKES